MGESSRPDAAGASMKRLAESTLKAAALLAIDESAPGTIPTVGVQHFQRALAMGERGR